jgi:hypothetical protein
MATYSATDLNAKPCWSGDKGNVGIFYGTYTGTPGTGDVWRLCKLPAGAKVIRTTRINADLGTAAPADFGFEPIDGSTGDDNAFGDDLALGTASTGAVTYFADAPVDVSRNSYVTFTFGTVDTGASGKVSVIIEAELFGAK